MHLFCSKYPLFPWFVCKTKKPGDTIADMTWLLSASAAL
jgi:hypothetical protein